MNRALVLAACTLALAAARPVSAQRARQAAAPAAPAASAAADTSAWAQLRFRYIGPVGNRVTSAVGVPGDPNTYYVGAASGGIFKTSDGGVHWQPIFDDQPVSSIGALAIAPSDPNIVWAGTGEAHIRSHISLGAGIYRSTDAGKTWTLMGLERTGRISRIVVHPTNPDIVYVAALGHAYGPQPERGVFRTMDGGRTWERVLFVDENTGASEIVMDPVNPRVLFAGMWQIEIHTWGRESGGPGSGIFTSRDGGTTWRRLTGNGLPERPVGKIALAIARTNPDRIYALIETGDGSPIHGQPTDRGELWRSDDGGRTWRVVSYDRQLAGRTQYYSRVVVAPDNEWQAYFLTAAFSWTLDGGATTVDAAPGTSPGGDNHDLWIDPTNASRMIVADDGGVQISTTRGRSWYHIQLPIGQMYHATTDNRVPYYVYGNRQDGPSYRGPSNSKLGNGGIPRGEWHSIAGGESGWATPDPEDSNLVWSTASGSGSVGGIVVRFDERTRQAHHVEVWPVSTGGWPAADLKYRFVWDAPFHISAHDHNRVYTGSQYVHVSTNGGRSWQVISPDLTLNDKSRQQISGGLTPDDIGVEYGDVVYRIAESRLKAGLIWAGTNDGLVHVTRDGGQNWTNVTASIPGLPAWGTVSSIAPSRYDTGTAYITVDFHQVNNRDPFVYRTTDYGRTWRAIANGIPRGPLSYAHVILEDPVRRSLLYLGTENALYVSFDDGESWRPLQNNLPHAPVYWLTIQESFNDLVVSTYGRGFWILDDLSPIQRLTPEVLASDATLLPPRPAYRFRDITAPAAQSDDPTAGQNPPYGAAINYWLKAVPQGPVTITIEDSAGATVRTLQGTKRAGMNRVMWDLRNEQTTEARAWTSPLYAPEVRMGPDGWRVMPAVGRFNVLMPPGTYTVRLTVGGESQNQRLSVLKDPNSGASDAEVASQASVMRGLWEDMNGAVEILNRIELVRGQLQQLGRVLAQDQSAAPVRAAADSLEQRFIALEEQLHQLRLTGRGQDGIRWPIKLAGQIGYLASGVASSDFAPTSQQLEVRQLFEEQLRARQAALAQLLNGDLARFNAMLRERDRANIVVP